MNVGLQSTLLLVRRRGLRLKQEGEVGLALQEEGNGMSPANTERKKIDRDGFFLINIDRGRSKVYLVDTWARCVAADLRGSCWRLSLSSLRPRLLEVGRKSEINAHVAFVQK